MSKLEEALEKAGELRESNSSVTNEKFRTFKKIETEGISNPYIVTVNAPNSFVTEEYRRLKSMLIRETKRDFQNSIMITSAINEEGKSLTAVNLAVTLAQEIDHSVLLIEADVRRPVIHKYLGIQYQYGLSDYLSGNVDISDILIKTGIGNMVYLPAGSAVANPVELLSSEKMEKFMSEIKHRYMDRYVIIDSPPILSCAESITIGSYADGIVFVVREGHAQLKAIEDALNMLGGLNVLGIVFNSVSNVNLEGHYASYYRYAHSDRGEKK